MGKLQQSWISALNGQPLNPSQDRPGQTQPTPPAQGQTGTADQDVQGRIQSALQQDSKLANVMVNVSDKKIDLSGTVATPEDKDKALSIAKSHAEGREIVDNIQVSSPSGAPPR